MSPTRVHRAQDSELEGVSYGEETDDHKSELDIRLENDHTFRGFWLSLDDDTQNMYAGLRPHVGPGFLSA